MTKASRVGPWGLAALWLTGCVGTDYLADPPGQIPPRLEVRPRMTALEVGEQVALEAVYFDELGRPVGGVELTWFSSDPAVASVSPGGVISGRSVGQVVIVAAAGTAMRDSVLVGVVADPAAQVATVVVTPASGSLGVGDSLALTAAGYNLGGARLEGLTYTWSSSDVDVVRIEADGTARALAAGTAAVWATTAGIASNAVSLTVMGQERVGVFVSRDPDHECRGTAYLRPGADGDLALDFGDDFFVTAGPALEVYLSKADRVGPGAVSLGPLQSTRGAQRYRLPADSGLADFDWVLIHCVPFNITFGKAQLK